MRCRNNNARNGRVRDGRTLTPLDQGISDAYESTTAKIRKGIVAGENVSVNANNVKLITSMGKVTLAGRSKADRRSVLSARLR